MGRRNEALRHYQRCEQVLQAELSVQPMPETTALFYAILRGEPLPALNSSDVRLTPVHQA
jgi:DNA-binding SARP family transcriptional activator